MSRLPQYSMPDIQPFDGVSALFHSSKLRVLHQLTGSVLAELCSCGRFGISIIGETLMSSHWGRALQFALPVFSVCVCLPEGPAINQSIADGEDLVLWSLPLSVNWQFLFSYVRKTKLAQVVQFSPVKCLFCSRPPPLQLKTAIHLSTHL